MRRAIEVYLAHIERARATLDEAADKELCRAVVTVLSKRPTPYPDPDEYGDLDRMIGPTV